MTRVEGENTRLRHYDARLHRKTLLHSVVRRNAQVVHSLARCITCNTKLSRELHQASLDSATPSRVQSEDLQERVANVERKLAGLGRLVG